MTHASPVLIDNGRITVRLKLDVAQALANIPTGERGAFVAALSETVRLGVDRIVADVRRVEASLTPRNNSRTDDYFNGPVWGFFELSYSSYLVLSRRVLCSMPRDWQEQFVALMERVPETLRIEQAPQYWVRRREGNRFVRDEDADYRHCGLVPLREPLAGAGRGRGR